MADWNQRHGVVLGVFLCMICCCFCNAGSDITSYKTHKWTKTISGDLISTTLTECDKICSHQCFWRYGQITISNSSNVTLYAERNDFGEYTCYKAGQVVLKVLVRPGSELWHACIYACSR